MTRTLEATDANFLLNSGKLSDCGKNIRVSESINDAVVIFLLCHNLLIYGRDLMGTISVLAFYIRYTRFVLRNHLDLDLHVCPDKHRIVIKIKAENAAKRIKLSRGAAEFQTTQSC